MNVEEILSQARDAMTVKRVFGEPYERDGVTVIPVAAVAGGGGGGSGESGDENSGGGAGFGVRARPVGMYVIKGDSVRWIPAFDLNRVIMGGQIVAIAALLTIRMIVRTIAQAKARAAEAATES